MKNVLKKIPLKYLFHGLVLAGLVLAGAKYLSGQKVLEALLRFDYKFFPLMLALSAGYYLLKAWRFVLFFRPINGELNWRVIFKAYLAGQAAALLPAGPTARAGLLKQVDVSLGKGSIPVIFSGATDQLVLIIGALVAALWFDRGRTPAFILMGVVLGLALLLIVPPTRRWLIRKIDWVAEKLNIAEQWQNFVKAVPEVLNPLTVSMTVAITVAAFALHIIAFDLSIRGVGTNLPYTTVMLVYILPTVLGRLSGMPGGFGVTEAGMVGFLTSVSDIGPDPAFAATALFRIATIVFTAVIGGIVYFFIWDGKEEKVASEAS